MKTAVITGSSGLIGTELCREFLALGYKVYGLDLKENPSLINPHFTFVKCDIGKEKDVSKAMGKLTGLDVLINNGAIANPENKKLHLMDFAEWNRVINTNLNSVFLLSKYGIPMLRKNLGSIINISSTRHLMSEPDTEAYSATKGAMDALTRSMAISLGPDIRVNSISPGWIADPHKKLSKKENGIHPVGRVGVPADVAKMAIYLASDAAGFVTGADFIVDGGMTAKMIY